VSALNLPTRSETLGLAIAAYSSPDEPELDYFRDSRWYKYLVLFIFFDVFSLTVVGFTFVVLGGDSNRLVTMLIPTPLPWQWFPVYNVIILFIYILHCLLIETFRLNQGSAFLGQNREKISKFLFILNFCFFLIFSGPACMLGFPDSFLTRQPNFSNGNFYGLGAVVGAGLYVIISISYKIHGLI
jgi:hypothetical protein